MIRMERSNISSTFIVSQMVVIRMTVVVFAVFEFVFPCPRELIIVPVERITSSVSVALEMIVVVPQVRMIWELLIQLL